MPRLDQARAPALRKGREGEKAAEQHRREGRVKRRRFVRPSKLEWPWAQKLAYLYLSAAPSTFPGNDQSGSFGWPKSP